MTDIAFVKTADPSTVTVEDVARWCDELGEFVRNNPDNPREWAIQCDALWKKMKAAETLRR